MKADVGTTLYQAFELGNANYNEKVDIFALGIILFELVSSFKTAFEKKTKIENLKNSIKNMNEASMSLNKKHSISSHTNTNNSDSFIIFDSSLSNKTKELILSLCEYNPDNRPSVYDILDYINCYHYFL